MKMVGLGESAQVLLDAFATQLGELGIDVPKTQYVGAGEIPWDGPSLCVYLGNIEQGYPGRPMGQSQRTASEVITAATLYVQLLRNVAVAGMRGGKVQNPATVTMGKEGTNALNDAGALMQAAILIKANQIVVPIGVDFVVGPVLPLGPEGGMAAMRISIGVSLDGS